MIRRLSRFGILATALLGVSTTGCGGAGAKVAHLQGAVTLNGKEIPADATAFVVFVADDDSTKSVSVPVTDGKYDSPQTPVGSIKAFFEITRPAGPPKKSQRTGQSYQDVKSLVPAKYATGLPLQVDADDPNRNLNLTD